MNLFSITVAVAFSAICLAPNFGEEKEFTVLFDGSSLDGWAQSGNWKILEDGSLHRAEKGGGIQYAAAKIPDDFELSFEWKVGEGANSGVYYRPGQYEYQILDNGKHNDGKNPRTSAASLYFCMAPSRDATKPQGEWNTARIVAKGTMIQHWLNGEKVIAFDYTDPQWSDQVELLRIRGADLAARGANLNFQDHGDPVWYRNVRIREIPAGEEIDSDQVTPAQIPAEILEAEKKKLEGIKKARAAKAAEKK